MAYEKVTKDGRYRSTEPCKSHPGLWQLSFGSVAVVNGRQIRSTYDVWLTKPTEAEARAWVDALPEETPPPRITRWREIQ